MRLGGSVGTGIEVETCSPKLLYEGIESEVKKCLKSK